MEIERKGLNRREVNRLVETLPSSLKSSIYQVLNDDLNQISDEIFLQMHQPGTSTCTNAATRLKSVIRRTLEDTGDVRMGDYSGVVYKIIEASIPSKMKREDYKNTGQVYERLLEGIEVFMKNF